MLFTLSLPETTNSTYRSGKGGWYKSQKAQAWEKEAFYLLKMQNKGNAPIAGNVSVSLVFYIKRNRDIDGGIKSVLDIMAKAGVYTNDQQVMKLSVEKVFDIVLPRTVVNIDILPEPKNAVI